MITKALHFFFSSIVVLASVFTLLNYTVENILLLGVLGFFNSRFLNIFELPWVLQLGLIGCLAGMFVKPTPMNCSIVMSLGFVETYLLITHLLNKYPNKYPSDCIDSLTESKTLKSGIVERTAKLKVVEPLLIQVEPAPVESIKRAPDLMQSPTPDTLMTLEYAKVFFRTKV